MSPVPCSLIWSLERWTPFAPVPSVNCSDRTTTCSDSREPETTGPRATTQREPNSSTAFWMSFARRPRGVTVFRLVPAWRSERFIRNCKAVSFRDSNSHTHSVEALGREWELCLSLRSARSIPIGLCRLSL